MLIIKNNNFQDIKNENKKTSTVKEWCPYG